MRQHDDAVAIAVDQEVDSLDGFLAPVAIATAGSHHHMAADGTQFDIGLLQDGAVVGAEEGGRVNTDHAQRFAGQRAADRRRAEIQLLDGGLHLFHGLCRDGASATDGARSGRHAHACQGCDVFQRCHEMNSLLSAAAPDAALRPERHPITAHYEEWGIMFDCSTFLRVFDNRFRPIPCNRNLSPVTSLPQTPAAPVAPRPKSVLFRSAALKRWWTPNRF